MKLVLHINCIILQHTIFGEVAEGLDVLQKINELYTDEQFRPFQDVSGMDFSAAASSQYSRVGQH